MHGLLTLFPALLFFRLCYLLAAWAPNLPICYLPYVYQIQLLDAQGQVLAESAPVTAYAGDSEPPGTVTDLNIRSDGQWGYQLSWTPATDNVAVTQYKIYRNQQPYSLSAGSEFHDPWPPTGEVSYQVQAVDGAGNVSPLFAPVVIVNH